MIPTGLLLTLSSLCGQYHSDVPMVALQATFAKPTGEPITDVSPQQFTVYEDGRPQRIERMARDTGPVSLGIFLDQSTSCPLIREQIKSASLALIEKLESPDELFLSGADGSTPQQMSPLSDRNHIPEILDQFQSGNHWDFSDSLRRSLQHLSRVGSWPKQALVVMTSNENASEKISAMKKVLPTILPPRLLLYVIAIRGLERQNHGKIWEQALDALARNTGGRTYFPASAAFAEADRSAQAIATELKSQFILEYTPSGTLDGTYRTVEIKMNRPDLCHARVRKGYLASPTPIFVGQARPSFP